MDLQSVHQFSRIYIEEDLIEDPRARELIERVASLGSEARVIPIGRYGEVFNRPRQNFGMQKHNPALILARERERFLYRGNERINSWKQNELYYNALVRNCVYNCDYCFLQGMHQSAHTVMFLNNDDFIDAARRQLEKGPMYLSISYLSEILAFEPLYPYSAEWLEFARGRRDFALEIRTKSDYYQAISSLKPSENSFLVWSLSPEDISREHERGCPPFRSRLFAASRAADDGWPLKLTFDPVLALDGWRERYRRAIEETFRRIPADRVKEVSFGVFRMNPDHLKRIRSFRLDAPYLHREYHRDNNAKLESYSPGKIDEIRRFMQDELSRQLPDERISFVHG